MSIEKSKVANDEVFHEIEDWHNTETNETTRYRVDIFGAKQAINHTTHNGNTSDCHENEDLLGIFPTKGKKISK